MKQLSGQAWVSRLRFGAASSYYRDDLEAEYLDRYSCHAYGRRDGLWIELFGPCCVALETALAWAQGAAEHVHLDEGYGRRWDLSDAQVRKDVAASLAEEPQLRWSQVPHRRWTASTQLTLGPRDIEEAGRNLETRSDHPSVLDPRLSTRGDSALVLDAVVVAPTLGIAADLAAHALKRWACGSAGLRDEMRNTLQVDYVTVRSPDGLITNDDDE